MRVCRSESAKLTRVRGAMAQFDTILPLLAQGQSVRRMEWEPFVRLFVLHDQLMCQCGNTTPWYHSLTWTEITASDWYPIQVESGVEQGHETSITPTLIPSSPERPLLKLSAESEPLRAVLLKWWNAE
jgi:hypothetical protein